MALPKWATTTRSILSFLFDIQNIITLFVWLIPLGGGAAIITGLINWLHVIPTLSIYLIGIGLLAILLSTVPRLWYFLQKRDQNKKGIEVDNSQNMQPKISQSNLKTLQQNQSTAIKADHSSNIKVDACLFEGFDRVVDADNKSEIEFKHSIATENKSNKIISGFEFFLNRDSLARKYPMSSWEKSKESIWGLWVAGTSAYTHSVIQEANIQRLILPHPDMITQAFADAVGKRKDDIIPHIKSLTNEALVKEKKLNIRILHWHKLPIGNTLTIGNPESLEAWIILETLIGGTSAPKRPSFRVRNVQPFDTIFQELMNSFNYYWKNSQPPTEEEIKRWLTP